MSGIGFIDALSTTIEIDMIVQILHKDFKYSLFYIIEKKINNLISKAKLVLY
jgi:hypothetical protein